MQNAVLGQIEPLHAQDHRGDPGCLDVLKLENRGAGVGEEICRAGPLFRLVSAREVLVVGGVVGTVIPAVLGGQAPRAAEPSRQADSASSSSRMSRRTTSSWGSGRPLTSLASRYRPSNSRSRSTVPCGGMIQVSPRRPLDGLGLTSGSDPDRRPPRL